MICSTGEATPREGIYKMSNKFHWLRLQGYVFGQYCSQIIGNILFHSVSYLEKENKGSLEYWEYDKLGQAASAGCIRLTVRDALWIYNNCKSGTQVEFYSSSNAGPLGKPSAKKISQYEEVRGWDPTDLDVNNPWNHYNQNQVTTSSNTTTANKVENTIASNTITNTITNVVANTIDNTVKPPVNNQINNQNLIKDNNISTNVLENKVKNDIITQSK